jgi:Na+-driven multidrug efflux pump
LAPLFIFVFHWGIRGAALATALAQLSGFVWVMYHYADKSSYIHFQSGSYKLKKRIIQDILSIGMSPFLMNLCASVIAIIINRSLVHYGGEQGDLAIGAYGIVNSLVLLFTMIVFGLNMGMQPIAGYNYGAKKNDRGRRLYQLVLIAATIILSVGCGIGLIFTNPIISLFTPNGVLHDLSVKATRIIVLSFPIVGFQIVTSSLFQSIGKAKLAILLSLSRQLIFLIPTLLLLPRFIGLNGVWAAIPVSDTLACIMTFFVLINHWKKLFPKNTAQKENA